MKTKLKLNTYYKLINSSTTEESIAYYYFNPDAKEAGFGFNIADGSGFLPEWDITDSTIIIELEFSDASPIELKEGSNKPLIVTPRNIISAFAYCIIAQSPYTKIDNLINILEDIRIYLITLGYPDENNLTDKYANALYTTQDSKDLYKQLELIRDNVKSFNDLNITKFELDKGITDANDPNRSIKFVMTDMHSHIQRDKDFIDLDACIRNVYNIISRDL